jgi:hypothetical protein
MGGRAGGGAGMGSRSALTRAVAKAENSIKGSSIENAYVFDSNGNIVFRRIEGEMHQMSSNPKLNALMNKLAANSHRVDIPPQHMANNIVTHNHPNASSLSSGDLSAAISGNAKEMRVVTLSTTYSLKRPKGGWGGVSTPSVIKSYNSVYSKSKDAHAAMKHVAKEFGLKYTSFPTK